MFNQCRNSKSFYCFLTRRTRYPRRTTLLAFKKKGGKENRNCYVERFMWKITYDNLTICVYWKFMWTEERNWTRFASGFCYKRLNENISGVPLDFPACFKLWTASSTPSHISLLKHYWKLLRRYNEAHRRSILTNH